MLLRTLPAWTRSCAMHLLWIFSLMITTMTELIILPILDPIPRAQGSGRYSQSMVRSRQVLPIILGARKRCFDRYIQISSSLALLIVPSIRILVLHRVACTHACMRSFYGGSYTINRCKVHFVIAGGLESIKAEILMHATSARTK